jgi:hypothetical protein
MKPNHNIAFWDYPPEIQKVTKGAMVYMVVKVTSHFTKGIFTQEIKTVLPNFPNISSGDSASSERGSVATPDQSDAETARLTRQNAKTNPPAAQAIKNGIQSGNGPTQIPTGGLENIANQAKPSVAGAASSAAYDIMGNATGMSADDDAGASSSPVVKPDNSRSFFSNILTPQKGRGAIRSYSNK